MILNINLAAPDLGSHVFLAENITQLDEFLTDTRYYASNQAKVIEVSVTSITPIPQQFNGTIAGKLDIRYNETQDETIKNKENLLTTGNFTLNGTNISMSLSAAKFLVFYEIQRVETEQTGA